MLERLRGEASTANIDVECSWHMDVVKDDLHKHQCHTGLLCQILTAWWKVTIFQYDIANERGCISILTLKKSMPSLQKSVNPSYHYNCGRMALLKRAGTDRGWYDGGLGSVGNEPQRFCSTCKLQTNFLLVITGLYECYKIQKCEV